MSFLFFSKNKTGKIPGKKYPLKLKAKTDKQNKQNH